MTIFSIVLGIAFFAFLVIVARQATEVQDYLDEVKMLKDHDLYD